MYFSKIVLHNFGIYKGRHCITLHNQNGRRNITLVGGMNGRGKTTILDAVFLCLYGRKATEYITGKKEAYASVLRDRINKSTPDQKTYITLEFALDDDSSSTISITRSWQRNGKKIDTQLEVLKTGFPDEYLSENWEYYVEELIPFGIAKFFFFDNEKISQIADDDAFDKVKDSIKSVMGVTTIESLCTRISKIAKSKTDSLKAFQDSESQAQLTRLTAQLEELDTQIRAVRARRSELVPMLKHLLDKLEKTEQEFWKKGGTLGLSKIEIQRQKEHLRAVESENKLRAINAASLPATPLCLCKSLVVSAYNAAKAQEQDRARQYAEPIVTALYDGLMSRCETEFGHTKLYPTLKEIIQAQFQEYRTPHTPAHSVELSPLSLSLIERFIDTEYTKAVTLARHLHEQRDTNENLLLQLDVHLNSSADQAGAVGLLEAIKDFETQKGRYEESIAKCDEELHALQNQQAAIESSRNKVLLQMAAQADANDDNSRILQYATITLDIMQEFTARLQAQKVHKLETNIAKCFHHLAQKQAIITSISIDPTTLDITLRDYDGGLLLKDQLSAGEKQMFAISILWGLALTSGYKLPVIIDTPMARLDSAHRTNFINRYLPNASSQVIVLSTDEEVYGQYLEDIRSYVNDSYTLIYDDMEKCSSIRPGYFGGDVQ
ncbi:DNA sulfur modification protein DndD [Ruminococcaceae bacterium AM28-23LB]|nr:DNA sulfur modification protein DndD [Ruminococcaceae bacterium AM28-23LB]